MASVINGSSTYHTPAGLRLFRMSATPITIPLIGGKISPFGAYQLSASLVLAGFWLRSSLAHLGNPYYFLSSIYQYQLVGPSVAPYVAMVLPSLQLLLMVCLCARIFVGGALFASSMLLAVFVTVQVSAWVRGLQIGCGCFGAGEQHEIGGGSLSTVFGLLALAVTAFLCWFGSSDRPRQALPLSQADEVE